MKVGRNTNVERYKASFLIAGHLINDYFGWLSLTLCHGMHVRGLALGIVFR
jgi:hypothetical protein